MRAGLRLEDQKNLRRFNDVREHVAEEHDLKMTDVVVEMAKVKVTPELHLEVPTLGTLKMTDWSKKQLGTILGVQWDKWFDPEIVKSQDIQEEIQKRFAKTNDSRKLRAKKFRAGSPGVPGCDGYLRAVLSPTYHPIDDEQLFNRIEKKFSTQVNELNFMKDHLNKHSTWGNDHCQYYTMVGAPINLGPIDRNNSNPEVRRIYDLAEREGKLPDADWVYPGIQMRNSEVGYTAITIDEFSFRLICLNGAMITVGDSRLMYRTHRPIENELLDKQLGDVFTKVPARWEGTRKNLLSLSAKGVAEPKKEIEKFLDKMEATKSFKEAAVKAFDLEPLPTMYGVLQAITRAAQDFAEDMDKRYEMETLAGTLIHDAPRLAAAA